MQIGNGLENLVWFLGVVEDRNDPTNHGRVRVRAFGFHPPLNTNEVLTEDLPWAFLINGTGGSFFSIPEEGDFVFGFFMDGRDAQHPFVLGVIHGAHYGIPYDGVVGYNDSGEFITGLDDDLSPRPSEKELYCGLRARGMSDAAAKGIVANMIAESNLNPGINEISPLVAGSRGGYGLIQWTGPRRRELESYSASGGSPVSDTSMQLDFLVYELQTSEAQSGRLLSGATDAVDAARIFYAYNLRPAVNGQIVDTQTRLNNFPNTSRYRNAVRLSNTDFGECD
jgi:hypothetical protein